MSNKNKFIGMRGPFGLSLSLEENSIKPLYCGDREIWLD